MSHHAPGQDEFLGYSEAAKQGILFIRSLTDDEVLDAARHFEGETHRLIHELMGSATNPCWISGHAIETAYRRGLINETELDYLSEKFG
jgi:hypothetical protein